MINSNFKEFFEGLFKPVAWFFAFLKITPNQLTVAGLLFGIATCLVFLTTQNLVLFFVLIVLSGLVDVFDGVLARLTKSESKFGAYLDAMCDRIFDIAAALTVAIFTGEWILIFLGLTGGLLVSYAKARAAMEAPVTNLEWPDLMERFERNIIFILGFFISEFFQIQFAGHTLFFWILIILNAAIYFTVIQRILRAKKLIEKRT